MNQHIHIWDATVYHSHSSVQFEAAIQLLRKVDISHCKNIIDLGCGDGKITAMIAKSLPDASILGLDLSPEMIDFAYRTFSNGENSNLEFKTKDIQDFCDPNRYEFIYSFFALQWIPDLKAVLRKIYQSLRPGGVFACIVPLNISLALDQAIQEIIIHPDWSRYFKEFVPGWHFHDVKEIQHLLEANDFLVDRIEVVLQEMSFPSREHLEKFILPWLTHLNRVPEPLKGMFSNQLFDRYLQINPSFEGSSVSYKYSRIESVSRKASRI